MKLMAVPLWAEKVVSGPDALAIGSGFLASVASRTFLVTAAHVPIDTLPHSDWSKWPRQLWFSPEVRSKAAFDLFTPGGDPLFFRVEDYTGMADFMAIPIRASASMMGGILARYAVFNFEQAVEPLTGSSVTMTGYPYTGVKWPYDPAEQMTGQIIGFNSGLIEIDTKPVKGFSGGPATVADGLLVGMTIGSEGGRGRLVRASWIREQLS